MSGFISNFIANNPLSDYISQTEQGYNIPSGLLGGLGYAESTLGANDTGGNVGGWGQFIPSTWNMMGGGNIMDDQQNITNSGAYLSQLYGQTGSWVTALQKYGTLPGDLTNLNSGQQNVLGIAQQADAGGGSGSSGGSVDPITGFATDDNGNPTGGGTILAGQSQGTLIAGNTALTTLAGDINGVYNWLKKLSPSDIALAIIVVVVAVIMLIFGLADLVFGKSAKEVIQVATSAVKSGAVE